MPFQIQRGLVQWTEKGMSMFSPDKYTRHLAIPLSKITQVEQTNRFVAFDCGTKWVHDCETEQKAANKYTELLTAIGKEKKEVKKVNEGPTPDLWAIQQITDYEELK